MIRISVLYPSSEGKKFDVNYYVNRHMKLVRERLGSFGLVRTEVDKGVAGGAPGAPATPLSTSVRDRKSTRLNSSHGYISYAVFCLKKKNTREDMSPAFHLALR